jgi:hypothetical protein
MHLFITIGNNNLVIEIDKPFTSYKYYLTSNLGNLSDNNISIALDINFIIFFI